MIRTIAVRIYQLPEVTKILNYKRNVYKCEIIDMCKDDHFSNGQVFVTFETDFEEMPQIECELMRLYHPIEL